MEARTRRVGFVPKEHGASFMAAHSLLLGITAGVAAGGDDWLGLALSIAVGALFLPLTAAVSVVTHPRLATAARRRAALLLIVLAVAGALAVWHGPAGELLALGGIGLAAGVAYAVSRSATGGRSVPTQLCAIAGISVLAPLAWVLVAGPTPRWHLSAPAAFLAFGGTVPYVRERVRRRRYEERAMGRRLRGGATALAWQAVALGVTVGLAAGRVVNPLVPAAFVPGVAKTAWGILRLETKPPIKRIGYVEAALSTVFAVLAGLGLAAEPPS
jgi:hypothetical protein